MLLEVVEYRGENMSEINIVEPSLLIRIARLYRKGMSALELYETTRGVWKIGKRREGAQYAMAVVHGVILEVYAIHKWHPAASTPYRTRLLKDVNIPGRYEFTGIVAPEVIRNKYIGQSIAHYFKRGCSVPILYANV